MSAIAPKVLLRSEESGGQVAIVELGGRGRPPLHRHDFDETFYVLEGELTFRLDDDVFTRRAGELAFAPRGIAHTYANLSGAPARVLLVITPAGFERYFEHRRAHQRHRAAARGSETDTRGGHARPAARRSQRNWMKDPTTNGVAAMPLVRVHNFAISLDGFGTGAGQTKDAPFGHAGERLHEWMFNTHWWQAGLTATNGGGVDDAFAQQYGPGIGAEIMGAGKFGHPGWKDDPEWKGAWGPNPPFHTPVFVLTHHTRPPIEMEGGTTFHFLDASPTEALEAAGKAAGGNDVRIGGGPTVIREFLAAGLIDHLHVVVVPILLGRGVPLWDDGLEGLETDYHVETTSSASGVTHVTLTRAEKVRT